MKKQETQKRGRARTPNNRTTTGFRIFEDLWADQDIHMHEPPTPDGVTLEPLLRWMEENAHRELSLEDIAAQAMMSTRSLSRHFREQTGTTPLQWLKRSRLRNAYWKRVVTRSSGSPCRSDLARKPPSATNSSNSSASAHRHTGVHSEDQLRTERG